MKEHLPVSRTTTSAIELHYLGVPAKTTGEGAETEFPVTSQPESKLPRHRNPAESKMSHRQGAQAQGRKGACSEWKRRGHACYISGTCYLHILPALCCRPPSARLSGCLPANHRGRQSACFHSFHSQLLCSCSSSPPLSVLPAFPSSSSSEEGGCWCKTNYTHPTMGSKDSDGKGPQGGQRQWVVCPLGWGEIHSDPLSGEWVPCKL